MLVTAAPSDTTKVQTSVLGELLQAKRDANGQTLESLSARSGIPVDRIEDVERGRHDLDDAELFKLLKTYGASPRSGLLNRLTVEVNLDAGSVTMRSNRASFGSRPLADRNLLSYLVLLHEHRGLDHGVTIPLKSVDLTLLRPALGIRRSEVTLHLERLTACMPSGIDSGRSLLAVAAAGLAVAAGAVILIPASTSQNPTAETSPDVGVTSAVEPIEGAPGQSYASGLTVVADGRVVMIQGSDVDPNAAPLDSGAAVIDGTEPQIGTALVMERAPVQVESQAIAESSFAGGDPKPEIGTALVVERSAADATSQMFESQTTPRGPPTGQGPPQEGHESP